MAPLKWESRLQRRRSGKPARRSAPRSSWARLLDVLGGSEYEVVYPNGDRVAYVTAVYEARIISGSPVPGDGELSEIA